MERERRVLELYNRIQHPVPPTQALLFDMEMARYFLQNTGWDVDWAEGVVRRHRRADRQASPTTPAPEYDSLSGDNNRPASLATNALDSQEEVRGDLDSQSQANRDNNEEIQHTGVMPDDLTVTSLESEAKILQARSSEQSSRDHHEDVDQPAWKGEKIESGAEETNRGTGTRVNATQAGVMTTTANDSKDNQLDVEKQSEELSESSECSSQKSWNSDFLPPWTPEHGGYLRIDNNGADFDWYYRRQPNSFWDGPFKFVRSNDYSSLNFVEFDEGSNGFSMPVFVKGMSDRAFKMKCEAEGLTTYTGKVDGFNLIRVLRPRVEGSEEQEHVSEVEGEGDDPGRTDYGMDDDGREADWYTVFDPSEKQLHGTVCFPQSEADLEAIMRLAGNYFELICVWAEVHVDPTRTRWQTFADDYLADGLVVVVDETEERPELETVQMVGPYGSDSYRRRLAERFRAQGNPGQAELVAPGDDQSPESQPNDGQPSDNEHAEDDPEDD